MTDNLRERCIAILDEADAEITRLQQALAAAETERDEARTKALESLSALCDQDAAYSGNQILITCHSHSDAIERMRVARETLATLRALSQEQSK